MALLNSIFLILLQISQAPDSVNVPTQTVNQSLDIIDLIYKGGVLMIPIILLSLVSIYLIVSEYFNIRYMAKIDNGFVQGIKDNIYNGNLSAAITMTKTTDSSLSRMLHWGLQRAGKPIKEIEYAIETAGNIEVSTMSKRLGYLGLIAGIAPMLGFVGTILGIIKIFYSIALSNNFGIGEVAGGMYEKMVTSCSGLIVGIIAFTGYHYLNMKIEKFSNRAEVVVFDFMNTLQSPNIK